MKIELNQFSLRTIAEAAVKYQALKQSVCGIMKRVVSAIVDAPNRWKKVEIWLPEAVTDSG
ncbi:hypothetical protein [Budvicia aquatica]|uniref:Uncharacterized protein n=1 Tax=Budvicia aquatica TaxID=82979 RepID=A0A2C6DJK0_9GAMM|nr:hypothetical protein [Budvicia aquatica]PHI29001.1 hypothetical protein CRN84_06565 [Budvicia aquatica]